MVLGSDFSGLALYVLGRLAIAVFLGGALVVVAYRLCRCRRGLWPVGIVIPAAPFVAAYVLKWGGLDPEIWLGFAIFGSILTATLLIANRRKQDADCGGKGS